MVSHVQKLVTHSCYYKYNENICLPIFYYIAYQKIIKYVK